jgi:phosphoribosyl 1,2-cyclic phosphodiesterase
MTIIRRNPDINADAEEACAAMRAHKTDFSLRFWGVRGSVPTSDDGTRRYGGNTSCLEICCGDRRLVFDAGTGIRYLGNKLCAEGKPVDLDLFLTHTHYDHICGIPFFTPFFVPGNQVRIWAGHLAPDNNIHDVLCELMMAPLFPVPPAIFQAQVEFRDFLCGETLSLSNRICLRTAPLNHPNGATGYRIDYDGRSICYLTDTEHVPGQLDQNILGLIENADLVVYDSMFTEDEYAARVGWGHSTWQAGADLCDAANAKTLVIFHHDPDHDDAFMDRIATEANQRRPGTVVAREGMVLHP